MDEDVIMSEFSLDTAISEGSADISVEKPTKKRRFFWIIFIFLVVAVAALGFFWFKRNANQELPHIVVQREDLKSVIDVSGAVFSERDVVLKASVSAQVLARLSAENQRVASGVPLLRLDASTSALQLQQSRTNLEASLTQAQSELSAAQKALEDALRRKALNQKNVANQQRKAEQNLEFQESEYLRQLRLATDGVVPTQKVDQQKQTLDQARLELKAAIDNLRLQERDQTEISTTRSRIQQAQTNLANARKQGQANIRLAEDSLSKNTVVAPFAGTVARWNVNRGDFVSPGTPIARFLDTLDLRLTLNVNELDLPKVRIGSAVEITFDAFPDTPYQGKVSWISESSVTNSDNAQVFPVKVWFANPKGQVRSGMGADARITASEHKQVLALPIASIHKKDGDFYVDLIEDGKPIQRKVKLGISTLDKVEVLSGLKAGDKIKVETSTLPSPARKP
jgi:HlyD family secretion protein